MKVKCNVCIDGTIVELPKPKEDKLICCPNCDKRLAIGETDYKNKVYWVVYDNEADENYWKPPVEIL